MISEENIPISLHKGTSLVYLSAPTEEFPFKHVIKTANGPNDRRTDGINNEYKILKKLEGKQVRQLLKKGLFEGKPALWLNYIEGITLDLRMRNVKSMAAKDFLKIAIGMAKQIQILHDANIIHKDLNLRNFLVDQRDQVFILDFQLSMSHEVKYLNFSNSDFITGTFETISPEQTGRVNWYIDNRSDLYSLGILFYEMLTGSSPFRCKSASEFIYAHLTEIPQSIRKIRKTVPSILSDLVDKLIKKDPSERYQSIEGLIYDLEKCAASLEKGHIPVFELASRDVNKKLKISEKLYGKEVIFDNLKQFFFDHNFSELKLALLEGPSGTGKNTLTYALHSEIAKHNGVFLQGKFRQDNVNKPLSAFVDVINAYIQVLQTKPEDHILEWKRRVQGLMGNSIQHLFPLMPNLRKILDASEHNEDSEVIDNQNRIIYLLAKLLFSLSNPSFPIVIYLDDIHWADDNSFNLLKFMFNMSDFKFMNIIGSFRREEAENSAPFVAFEKFLKERDFPVQSIQLENLNQSQTAELLSDSLDTPLEPSENLVKEIFQKTDGNPFFIRRFVQTLYEDGHLWMDTKVLKWKWNTEAIQQSSYTNNVVSLLVEKLNNIDEASRNLLQIASCYGFSFPSSLLLEFRPDITEENLKLILDQLVTDKMIYPIPPELGNTNQNEFGLQVDYQFTHDKLFEASNYSLDLNIRNGYHWSIGKIMLRKIDMNKIAEVEDIFNLVNHLNLGGDSAEKSDHSPLFKINYCAGKKAKKAGSFTIARDYLERALDYSKILNLNKKEQQNLELELTESFQFNGETKQAEKKYYELLEANSDKFERAKIGEKMIHFYANTGRHEEAYHLGAKLLKAFGKNFSAKPSKPRLIANIALTKIATRKLNYADLLQLKVATNEEHITVIKLIAAMLKSAYQIAPELCVEGAAKMVRYCAKHGNTSDSPVGYFVFGGIFLGGVFGNHETGYNFGNLSLELVDRFNSEKQRSEIEFIHGYFCNTWVKGPISTTSYFEKAYRSGSLTGDFFHMSCSRAAHAENMLLFGSSLEDTMNDAGDYQHFVRQSKNTEALIALESVKYASNALRQPSFETKTTLPSFSEETFELGRTSYSSKHFIHMHYINQMMLCFHLNQIEKGMKYVTVSEGLNDGSSGLQQVVFHHFYTVLLCTLKSKANYDKLDSTRVKKGIKYLEKCADFNADLYQPMLWIAKSFQSNVKGKQKEAINFVLKAIADLKSKLEVNLLGIAAEHLCKLYWETQNIRKFHETMTIAFEAYNTWGAKSILDKLKKEYRLKPDMVPSSAQVEKSSQFSSTVSSHDLDINSVLKFSRAITEEVNLDQLVKKVLKIMVENTASTSAYLIIRQGEIPYIYASFENNQMESMQKINLREFQESSRYPVGIIHYVMRTKDAMIIDDAKTSEYFSTDNYVVKNKTKSILCQPLLMQKETIGVLYLDSQMSEKLYNERKVQMLQLLSTQIAISINNSMNFEELESTVNERTEELLQQRDLTALKNKEIGESIQYARTIQEAILPDSNRFNEYFTNHYILSKPKDIVSGDFYWMVEEGDEIIFAVADCTGHGVPAAMLSVVCNNALNRSVRELKHFEPAKILDAASEIISKTFSDKRASNQIKKIQDGMDVSICSFNRRTKTLKYSGAHNPLLILTKNEQDQFELTEIKGDKQPVGPYFKIQPFNQHERTMSPGEIIVLSTDGYHDQFGGPNSKKMKAKAFKKYLVELAQESFDDHKFRLDAHFSAWMGGELQLDDVTVLGIQV